MRSSVSLGMGLSVSVLLFALVQGACGSTDVPLFDSQPDGSLPQDDSGTGFGEGPDSGPVDKNYKCPSCPDFPPVTGAKACTPDILAPPQLVYPNDGTLLPPNMNVLEAQFVPPPKATLYEVDFTNASTSVKVEARCSAVPDVRGGASRGCGVTLPQAAWNDIAGHNRDGDPVHITVRATIDGQCVSTSTAKVDLLFAKEDMAGGIYYWQSATYAGIGGETGGIYSHDFGTLDPTPKPFYTSGASGTCVGCHNLSRDGARVALATDDPDGDDEFGDVKTGVMDVASKTALGGGISPGFQTYTHDHAKLIASTFKQKNMGFDVFDGDGKNKLATSTLPTGMTATQPDLSRDDQTLVFVVPAAGTIAKEGDHHFFGGSLYTSTFNASANALGGPISILPSNGSRNYYYPSFAPDKSFIVFNDAPQPGNTATGNNDAFYNRNARVKILKYPPAAGAAPIDLPNLNVADGLTNSWPRWSPFVQTYKGKKLLWVTFSSNRDYGLHLANKGFDNCYPPEGPTYDDPQPLSKKDVTYADCAQPQIWMAAVIVDGDPSLDGKDRSFPAFWLPFQDVNSHNHSAQWVEKVAGGGSACLSSGDTCGSGGSVCCNDYVCCGGTCQSDCTIIH